MAADSSPLLRHKHFSAPAVFRPENLLREARRQRGVAAVPVPEICLLDPDGDIVRALRAGGHAEAAAGWACYHSEMLTFALAGERVGIVGCAVGAPYAVLVAEQMFASGCRLLVSLTSAGRIAKDLPASSFFMLIERALRDDGTSHHYLPAGDPFAHADPVLLGRFAGLALLRGVTWTTDAPFRETAQAIASARAEGVAAVEMEAAGLYALATARDVAILCLAHVTNSMAQTEGDFEKGDADGSTDALALLAKVVRSWRA